MVKSLLKSLKFNLVSAVLLFANYSFAQSDWQILANETQIASTSSNFTSLVTVSVNGTTVPYLGYTESSVAKVKRFINGAWEQVGGNVSAGNASYLTLSADKNGKLYLQYVDVVNGNKLAVKIFNTNTGSWEAAGNSLHASTGPILNGQSEERIPYNNSLAFDSNNVPYVTFGEFPTAGTGLGNAWVKKLVAGEWQTVGSGAINTTDRANSIDIDLTSDNIPYVVYHDGTTGGQIKAFRFVNNAWENLTVPAAIGSLSLAGARTTRLVIDRKTNKVVINFSNTASGTTANALTLTDAGAWTTLGGRIGSGAAATYTSTISDSNGNIYALFRDQMSSSNGTFKARLHEFAKGSRSWAEVGAGGGFDGPIGGYTTLSYGADRNMYVAYLKSNSNSVSTPVVQVLKQETKMPADVPVTAAKQMEYLDRGLVAVRTSPNQVFLSWRLLGTDPADVSFNVYRDGEKINPTPITGSTNYADNGTAAATYTVKPIVNGQEKAASAPAAIWAENYFSLPLQIPAGGTTPDNVAYTYVANDCSVGDLDGDGVYEIIVKWEPTNSSDNSNDGYTGNTFIDGYKLNGTRLWRIDLGRNIRSGAHYTPFTVYDFDGDGKAELACRTADGTVDGVGNVIGNRTADYRNAQGKVLSGPEFLTVFNGLTGAALASADYYPARGLVSSWGDDTGNRVDRFVDAVAYLDGMKPSLITGRGYYTRLVRVAWDWRNGQLTRRWVFDSSTLGNSGYYGQGNHQITVGDVDGDGKDEVLNGSSAINDNGEGLWTDGKGHGDAMHLTDMDPDLPGKELWMCHEDQSSYVDKGLTFRKAATGETLFGVATTGDIGRSMAADIDPRHKGYEVWGPRGGLYNAKGEEISATKPSTMNFGIWWDADLQREFLDNVTISKWNHLSGSTGTQLSPVGVASNNSTKATPNLSADILGDWREEVIWRTSDNTALRIYTSTDVTTHRIPTLMHDAQYRVAISWQNSGYNQPPYPSFYLGTDMAALPQPNITTVIATPLKPVISAQTSLTICNGNAAVLNSSSAVGNQWYKDGIIINGAVNSSYSATSAGVYTVITTIEGKSSPASDGVVVTVNAAPVAVITPAGSTTILTGASVVLNGATGAGYTYKWFKDGAELEGQITPTLTVNSAGSYTLRVSANGCTASSSPVVVSVIFSLPANNFRVTGTPATCKGSANGKISVLATATGYNYTATLKKRAETIPYNFTSNTLDITGLTAGAYELCIAVQGQPDYKQCFNINISEPAALSVYASVNESEKTVDLTLSGAEKYYVELNGKTLTTTEGHLTLNLAAGSGNVLKVSSDVTCQGIFEKVLTLANSISVYPNPIAEVLNVNLGSSVSGEVGVELYSLDGKQVYSKRDKGAERNLQVNMSSLSPGIYLLKLKTDESEVSFKVIKK
ncbi:T9SS type A sorting domain-containing protein [Pedobacter sp. SYSU D00535]|uniref:rhamnogalacturonan lyase family protein n=1 Tax=Pedobacter sp. SYSU D00535 TaxID=2810308 RepID=UPI001A967E3F|nr:T9SS type A sorting domain-containing protein [Pedobacter sp. SYSU D00535]